MTDRELLELAAHATGIEILGWYGNGCAGIAGACEWNPLTDDGDALRLAITLGLTIHIFRSGPIFVNQTIPNKGLQGVEVKVDGRSDFFAATRRAIVRAAAEIGKGMA